MRETIEGAVRRFLNAEVANCEIEVVTSVALETGNGLVASGGKDASK